MSNKNPDEGVIITAQYGIDELMGRLRRVTLLNEVIPGFYPYLPSKVSIEELSPDDLWPCALYVLNENLENQKRLRAVLLTQGIDTLHLTESACLVDFQLGDSELTISPPIVEVSEDDGGKKVATDGLHRITIAKEINEASIAVALIQNIAAPLPALPVDWEEVKRVDKVPPNQTKRKFRFRSTNEVLDWPNQSDRNRQRFLSGFAEQPNPLAHLGLMHTYKP